MKLTATLGLECRVFRAAEASEEKSDYCGALRQNATNPVLASPNTDDRAPAKSTPDRGGRQIVPATWQVLRGNDSPLRECEGSGGEEGGKGGDSFKHSSRLHWSSQTAFQTSLQSSHEQINLQTNHEQISLQTGHEQKSAHTIRDQTTTPHQHDTTTLFHRPTGLTIILPAESNGWFYFSPGGDFSFFSALAAGGEASGTGAAGCGR